VTARTEIVAPLIGRAQDRQRGDLDALARQLSTLSAVAPHGCGVTLYPEEARLLATLVRHAEHVARVADREREAEALIERAQAAILRSARPLPVVDLWVRALIGGCAAVYAADAILVLARLGGMP
jgi:hypothetical protein